MQSANNHGNIRRFRILFVCESVCVCTSYVCVCVCAHYFNVASVFTVNNNNNITTTTARIIIIMIQVLQNPKISLSLSSESTRLSESVSQRVSQRLCSHHRLRLAPSFPTRKWAGSTPWPPVPTRRGRRHSGPAAPPS